MRHPLAGLACLAALLAAGTQANAQASKPAAADPRIREVAYDGARVVTVAVQPGVTTLVQFAPDEHVRSLAAGQAASCAQASDPWCVTWPANAGFVYVRPNTRASQPLALAVVTDRHAYSLLFEPLPAAAGRAPVFRLTFTYPPGPAAVRPQDQPADRGSDRARAGASAPATVVPPITDAQLVAERMQFEPVPLNASYTVAYGEHSQELRPQLAFDDGRFTYLKWAGNREIPAVFEIRADGSETVANTRMQGDLIVVDRIARGLMLRSGSAVASVRNEAFDPVGLAPVGGTTVPGIERAIKEPRDE